MLSAPGTGLQVNDLAGVNLVRGVEDSSPPNIFTSYGGNQTSGGNDGYGTPASGNTQLNPGEGFFWYFFDSSNPRDLSAGELASVQPLPIAVTAAVSALSADRDVDFPARDPIAGDDAFYLAGNPFDSDFDLGGISVTTGQTVQDVVQIWDPAGADTGEPGNIGPGGYISYSRSGANSNPRVVTPWQGFWLEITDGPSPPGNTSNAAVTVRYAFNSAGQTGGNFVGRQAASNGFKLEMLGTSTDGQRIRNEVSLLFHDEAADGWDRFDGSSPGSFGTPFVLAGLIGQRGDEPDAWKYQDSRPLLTEGTQTFRLAYTGFGVEPAYEFAWPSLDNVPAEWALTLRDLMTGTEIDMRTQPSYAFEAMEGEPETRFEVVVMANPVANTDDALPSGFAVGEAYPNPTATAATLGVTVAEAQEVEVTVYDVLGRVVLADAVALRAGAEEQIEVGVAGLPAGTYVVRLAGEAFAATRRLTVVR
ncbi:MAG: T9SS type A sorting domain-containing protein [Bacteroidota bacterium]